MKRAFFSLLILLSLSLQAQDYSKLSSFVRQLAYERVHASETRAAADDSAMASLRRVMLVRGDEETLAPFCLTHQGDLHLCSLTIDEAIALSLETGVSRIQATPSSLSTNLDTLTHITSVDKIWQGEQLPQAYTGKGVLIGVPDAGIEYAHPVFRDATDGHLRIVRAWDKLDIGEAFEYQKNCVFPIGKLHTSEEEILGKAYSVDSELTTHGTSTMSVAAGIAAGTPFSGIAYEADLYSTTELISNNKSLIDKKYQNLYTDELMLLSYSNIFAYADSVGQPCVISCSLGSTQDMTDVEIMKEEYMQRLLAPGHVFVAAAGNSGRERHYLHKPASMASIGSGIISSKESSAINISTNAPLLMRLTNWSGETPHSYDFPLDIKIGEEESASGLVWDGFTPVDTLSDFHDITIEIYCGYDGFDHSRVGYDIFLRYPDEQLLRRDACTVEFIGQDSDAEIFIQRGEFVDFSNDKVDFDGAPVGLGTLNSPASLPSVITVGATSHRIKWQRYDGKIKTLAMPEPFADRADFSSCGPTLHGVMKPDVVAPGVAVISALNSVYCEANETLAKSRLTLKLAPDGGKEYPWGVDSGTSLAAPVVAGIIALWLQADPTLTTERIKKIIAKTCRQEDSMLNLPTSEAGVWPNNECGYGEINAYKGLLEVLGLSHIPGMSDKQLQHVSFAPDGGGNLRLSFVEALSDSVTCSVYAVDGHLLCRETLAKGEQEITLHLPAYTGVVAVQIEGMGSTLIRL